MFKNIERNMNTIWIILSKKMIMLEMKNTTPEKNSLDRDEKNTPKVTVSELETEQMSYPE